MRYIGNKTKLLGFIRDTLRRRGIRRGRALDPFTGTASVARELKALGFGVVAADIMEYAYVFARAYVQVAAEPGFEGVAGETGGAASLPDVVAHLNRLEPRTGFIRREFSPGADGPERMYFTSENAGRIDAVRATLHRWRDAGAVDDDGYHLLLAALLEAADRVANTAGVYAAYIKSWQPNARRRLRLQAPPIIAGNGCHAQRADALELVRGAGPFELLYLDPPYNTRQYPGYYHVPELIASARDDAPPPLRGKTGLAPDRDKRSDWARRARCEQALEAIVDAARCRHIVLSYNSEGIIPEDAIRRVLQRHGRAGTFELYRRRYRRYRADADGDNRRYRGDRVEERLYCVEKGF